MSVFKLFAVMSACVLLQCSSGAQTRNGTVPELVINEPVVPGKLILQGNRYWVSIEDLARSLQGTIVYQRERIILSFGAPPVPPTAAPMPAVSAQVAAPPKALGTIRGVLSYYFNANYGNKPDVGAEAIFVAGSVTLPLDQYYRGSVEGHPMLRRTMVDGNGNFEMHGLPTGTYTVVIRSQHARGTDKRDLGGLVYTQTVVLDENQPEADASHDFGASEF